MPFSLPAFQYKPIDAKKDIRILVLHPSDSFDDPLEGHLESQPLIKSTITLEGVPGNYEAVSYFEKAIILKQTSPCASYPQVFNLETVCSI